jgi:hypothetical protein
MAELVGFTQTPFALSLSKGSFSHSDKEVTGFDPCLRRG